MKTTATLLKSVKSWGQSKSNNEIIEFRKNDKNNDWKSYCIFPDGGIRFFTLSVDDMKQIQLIKKGLESKIIKGTGKKTFISDFWTRDESDFYFLCNSKGISKNVDFISL